MKILAIGTMTDKAHPFVTGQTVVFGLLHKYFNGNADVRVINIAERGSSSRGSIGFLISRIYQYFCVYIKLVVELLFNRPDVLYYQGAWSKFGIQRDLIAYSIIKIWGVPVVNHQLGYIKLADIESLGESYIKKLRKINDASAAVIVEGELMKSQYIKVISDISKVSAIPNGFEENKGNKPTKTIQEPFRILYLSNFIFSKGYLDVLKAVDLLANQYHIDVQCVFAGKFYKGFESEDNDAELGTQEFFFNYIKEHQLESRVQYYPGLFGDEKAAAFKNANAFALPSYYAGEGQPMAILEAMSYGCVPIVTEHGHIPMMVNRDNGCIVERKNAESIANAVIDLIQEPDQYRNKSEKCIKDFHTKFSYEAFASSVFEVLKQSI